MGRRTVALALVAALLAPACMDTTSGDDSQDAFDSGDEDAIWLLIFLFALCDVSAVGALPDAIETDGALVADATIRSSGVDRTTQPAVVVRKGDWSGFLLESNDSEGAAAVAFAVQGPIESLGDAPTLVRAAFGPRPGEWEREVSADEITIVDTGETPDGSRTFAFHARFEDRELEGSFEVRVEP